MSINLHEHKTKGAMASVVALDVPLASTLRCGALGVLLQAKRAGLISAVATLLNLIVRSPVFLNKELLKTVLDLAGEN